MLTGYNLDASLNNSATQHSCGEWLRYLYKSRSDNNIRISRNGCIQNLLDVYWIMLTIPIILQNILIFLTQCVV